MILNIYAVTLRIVCVVYLMYFMYGFDTSNKLIKSMSIMQKVLSCVVIIFLTLSANGGKAYFFIVLFIEYITLIVIAALRHKMEFKIAVRGISGIFISIATDILILFVAYGTEPNWLSDDMRSFNSHIIVVGYLGSALGLCQLNAIQNIRKGMWELYPRKSVLLIVKTIECWMLLYLCAACEAYDLTYHMLLILLSLGVLIEYPIILKASRNVFNTTTSNPQDNSHANLYEYYLELEEEHRKVRKMYHEMKNQVMILKETDSLIVDENGVKSADQLMEEINNARSTYNTGIPTLNAILFEGSNKAKANDIDFDVVIEENCLSFIKDDDIEHIFRNAILNAIEACDKITDGEKWIKIKAGKNEDEVLVFIKNSVGNKLENGNLGTSKADKTLHGIGLTAIRETAEKYNGYVSVVEDGMTFQLAILFSRGQMNE